MHYQIPLTEADHPLADAKSLEPALTSVAHQRKLQSMDTDRDRARPGVAAGAARFTGAVNPAVIQAQMALWQTAASLACRLHRGQVRKDGWTPYVAHPFRVAMIVANIFIEKDPVVAAAALLHDAIEDTPADREEIAEKVSPEVAAVVCELTKDMRLPEEERERQYLESIRNASWQARLIKLADVYDNLCDSVNDGMRRKCIGKAREAIAVAGDDHPSLLIATAILEDLIDIVEADVNNGVGAPE